jgi:hypothetical protein
MLMLLVYLIEAKIMNIEKVLITAINIALAITFTLLLLSGTPWANAPLTALSYYIAVVLFWLLLLLRLLLAQWQKTHIITYKSYIGPDNKIRKKLILPDRKEIARIAAGLLKPHYITVLAAMALLFLLNHLLLFYPGFLATQFPLLFNAAGTNHLSQENILLSACLASVLALAATVLTQTQEIKQNNQTYSIQNLIIKAHSHAILAGLRVRFDDDDQMFLSTNKLEYVLQAKVTPALPQPQSQTLLHMGISIKLRDDIPVTEFYVKRLSLFVADAVIECENYHRKYYSLFFSNNTFTLDFYILCRETSAQMLAERFFSAAGLRLYFSFILKNGVGVITEFYGTALYEREYSAGSSFNYLLQEAKDNQCFYM